MKNEYRDYLNESLQIIKNISRLLNINCELNDSKYKNNQDLLNDPIFRTDLYNTLHHLLTFYNENNYYEEKYMMLLIHLIFGVNPMNNNSSNLSKQKKRTTLSNVPLSGASFVNYYKDQNNNLCELTLIIIQAIKKINDLVNEDNKINQNEEEEDEEEDEIRCLFESQIIDYFNKHFCLFSESVRQLIDVLYDELEFEPIEYKDYVLFMKILIENKANYRPLLVAKFNRTLEQYTREEIELLSLKEEVDFSNEFDIIKITQKLKALNYLSKQKLYNSSMILYDDIKYINKNFLKSKYQISLHKYEEIYQYNTSKVSKSQEVNLNIKDQLKSEIEKVKVELKCLVNNFQIIKDSFTQAQNNFNSSMNRLTEKLTSLELTIEKLD